MSAKIHETPKIGHECGRWTVVGAELIDHRHSRVVPCVCKCGAKKNLPVCKIVNRQVSMCLGCAREAARRQLRRVMR